MFNALFEVFHCTKLSRVQDSGRGTMVPERLPHTTEIRGSNPVPKSFLKQRDLEWPTLDKQSSGTLIQLLQEYH